ncbi:MAG: radical SAM protein [Oscillospiraceae bacterium]|nr:radical SAM protein [Oscillospiraceae bacterium]
MKMLMIHAWNETERSYRGRFSSLFSYPSLTLAAMYPLIPDEIFETIDVVDEKSSRVCYDKIKYDLVIISADTSSAITAYRHSEEFRKRGSYTVIGGYHASAMPDEALLHCDTVIIGPAENSLPKFCSDFRDGTPENIYKDYNVSAADFPVPVRNKQSKRHSLDIPGIIADRGCDNHCRYCSMSIMWKSDPRPVDDVIDELRSLRTRMVIFYDPNFFAKREYAIKLMRAMQPLKILWASNATADFGNDHELMQAAYDSGCRGVLLGLESLNSESLKNAAKRFNDSDRYKQIIDNLHSHGIAVNGCFVLGFDSDTEEELLKLPARIDNLGLDLCRFALLTPYPGTRYFDDYDKAGRIITKDWSQYTQKNVVFRPANMTPERLESISRQVWHETFSWRRIFKRTFSSPWKLKPYIFVLLGANIGFRFLGNDKECRK